MRSLRVIPSRYFQPQHPKMNDLYIKVNTFIFFTCNIIIKHIPIIKYIIVKEMHFDKKMSIFFRIFECHAHREVCIDKFEVIHILLLHRKYSC